jgi:DNA polymerase-3 subunit epsilon
LGEDTANVIRLRAVAQLFERQAGCSDSRTTRTPSIPDVSRPPLSELEVLVVDCQATAAAPRGHLLEVGWARLRTTIVQAQARLIALPAGERIPPAVARITGLSEGMMRDGVDARLAWRELSAQAASLAQQPAPTVVHFARFEQPFLYALAGGVPPLDLVCNHHIARRLFPDLPRCTLRALTGYFGRAVSALRRSAHHVEATAFVWRELVRLLDKEGVSTWRSLREWLAAPAHSTTRPRRAWPMPRDVRLSLPDAPGVYRMLRTSGDVLYIGKASSLHRRVNSYFRKQCGVPERLLEMLSQARAISFEVTPSALEAALLEPDEIKRHRPPYNVALAANDRTVSFTSADLGTRSPHSSPRCPLGPFPSAEALDQFDALARSDGAALERGRWGPDAATFNAGYARLCAAHHELSRDDLGAHARLLRLGTRLWEEGRRDHDPDDDGATGTGRGVAQWTPELVQVSLERIALRGALARRRAIWLTRLIDATVVWSEPGSTGARLMIIENGEIVLRSAFDPAVTPPIPPGHRRAVAARHEAVTVACFDRLRVLTSELKRLVAAGAPVALRLGVAPAMTDARLASALSWV